MANDSTIEIHGDHKDGNGSSNDDIHVTALYAVFLILVVAQIGLLYWKKSHKRSFELVTLIGLWILPFIFSVKMKFWRFLIIWFAFSMVTGYILFLCASKNFSSKTPRTVYTWFFASYKISVFIGVCGYTLLLIEFFGMVPIFMKLGIEATPVLLLWYGLYFGILGRDCAEVASDWMQSGVMGGRKRLTVSTNKCGICDKDLCIPSDDAHEDNVEMTIVLSCKHTFHEFCIRGWTLIGKKDTCPSCSEKVDLEEIYANRPWESTNLSWIKMLDVFRYLIVWNPIIVLLIQGLLVFTN